MIIYCWIIILFLLASGLAHLIVPKFTDNLLSKPTVIRLIGALLVVLAIPGFVLLERKYWFFFIGLLISGFWRLLYPAHSIRMQKTLYPRSVHGLLMAGGAMVLALFMFLYFRS